MEVFSPPDPTAFASKIAKLHTSTSSPTGKFGFHCPTVCGSIPRTAILNHRWANSFTYLLRDVLKYDNAVNPPWPEFDRACTIIIDKVIPSVLGALQSDGRSIRPVLIHGDLWEQNVGIDKVTKDILIFDPGCTYAHNEMEFGTWGGSWTTYFQDPRYLEEYKKLIQPSKPMEQWDDRNRIYSLHININNSAGHPGSGSRRV